VNRFFWNSFTVMPAQCNYHYPMIFGGAFISELDLCAASCVSRLLHDSECNQAVTYKVLDITFHAAAEAGDIIFMSAEVVELRHKAVTVRVKAERERRAVAGRDHIADATFVFVTKKDGVFTPHGLMMPEVI
jgi:acyl-CoA hydrolase